MKIFIMIVVAVINMIAINLSYAYESYDYKLFKPLEFKDYSVCGNISRHGLNQLYKLELIPSDISFVGKEGNVILTNCNVYIKARQLGASPQSNYDIGMNNYYNFICSTLNALKFSKKALRSFVDPKIPEISQLPVAIFVPPTNDEGDKLLTDSQKGITVADYCRDNKMQCDRSGEVITIEDSEGVTRLELVSLGDFDQDGLDDILIYFTDYGKTSTWHNYGFILLSKSTKNQKLYNMRNIYGGCVMEKNKYKCADKYQWEPKK